MQMFSSLSSQKHPALALALLMWLPSWAVAETTTSLAPVTVTETADLHGTHLSPFGGGGWQDAPVSLNTIQRAQLDQQQVHTLSELTRTDAALGDDYAPVGYYQNLSIRGFPLDLASGYRTNGLPRVGEQRLAYENVESIELLKGFAGISAGMAEPAGLVNLVTKRPREVKHLTLAGDREGAAYGAVDAGHWLTPALGMRLNVARERLASWVEHAEGERNLVALATDWLVDDSTSLEADLDYQTSAQRSVSGYQLLGVNGIPKPKHWDEMLGYQPWQQPVGMQALNASLRLNRDLNADWRLQLALGRSQSRIDDNVAFAYGSCLDALCTSSGTPYYHFAANGDYGIYDYRSPDEQRRVDAVRLVLNGGFHTGVLFHALSFGSEISRRTLERRREVYDWIGVGNITAGSAPILSPSSAQPGPRRKRLDSRERSAFLLDRVSFNEHWQGVVGVKHTAFREHTWSDTGVLEHDRHPAAVLPQLALLWLPTERTTHYLSWSKGIAPGLEAPYWTHNAGEVLSPRRSRQLELGSKYALRPELKLSAALYRVEEEAEMALPDATPEGFTFGKRGKEVHTGVELSFAGRPTRNLDVWLSVNAMRARLENTGLVGYGGHQAVNAPALRLNLWLDYRLPDWSGFSVQGGVRHASANTATANGHVRVPAWTVADAGVTWRDQWRERALTLQLNVTNLCNHFYWRDTGSMLGDSYLFPGAPREIRLAMQVEL